MICPNFQMEGNILDDIEKLNIQITRRKSGKSSPIILEHILSLPIAEENNKI